MANSSTGINGLTNIPLLGINLGSHANARQIVPGEAGTHYFWPTRDTITLWVKQRGVRLIRFPFEVQRAINLTNEGLPGQGASLDTTFVSKWKELLGWIRADSNGEAKIIPDPHHYMRLMRYETANGKMTGRLLPANEAGNQGNRWKATEPVLINDSNSISGAAWSAIHLANFHQKLVQSCDDPMVLGWGLGNEPYFNEQTGATDYITQAGMKTLYINTMNTVLKYLRNSSSKPVFICGLQFASARNWETYSADLQAQIVDPANAIVWEVHGYGDVNNSSSGAYEGDNTQIKADIFTSADYGIFSPMFKYASDHKMATYIGEVGVPGTDAGRTALKNLLERLKLEKVPATLWITGPGSETEKMSLERSDQASTVAMVMPYFAQRLSHWNYSAS
ncbi:MULTISPECIES: cellulase family glycosylhydrolase [unclassified Pseudomonas]|uniref:cellulase family glycosylhydrolase n=1 Tax=unclassified Pseudomonas TaxID=196821 RepID=UPI000BD452C3|nr:MULTISPECIES: cellulase family glycosylhydrolase [unclassified Pseudomonas]PVZ19539.1 cellulase (glycosyl hydrolase family 5) [Pseudomonas sp. URIL14HWK12:I12]PVZ22876.1 cellulase (glycosyl hydrolase family 5) [Pseudomonas sp. URIL14HWK12:I10]PVZ37494.1 cellulase (glycosyl hydrolase family 5) [Pseudomonas sp. URIL14HWK12:I11]SNZ14919.1 Cellulase (glycosyl hydrolase family 5) [Pseudomonas sp. URIL14HWK12:I9]